MSSGRLTISDNRVVGGIYVDRLVQRERGVIAIKRSVRGGVEGGQRRLRQASHELLDVTDTLSCSCRVSRTVTVPEGEIWDKIQSTLPTASTADACLDTAGEAFDQNAAASRV